MYNTSLRFCSPITFLSTSPPKPHTTHLRLSHGNHPALMFNLLLVSSHLSSLLLLLHLSSFLLTKLLSIHHQAVTTKRSEDGSFFSAAAVADEPCGQEDLVAEESPFAYGGSHGEKDTLLGNEGRDTKEQILLGQNNDFVLDSPQEDLPMEGHPIVSHISHRLAFEGYNNTTVVEKLPTAETTHSEGDKLKGDEVRQEKESCGGSFTFTGESTSKSSMEWRSSTIFQDSETEYPFSSSSRRSSANWESYAMFRKYDEEMLLYYRISAQKLSETESFRSISHKPRALSKRIVNTLMPKHKSSSTGKTNPFQELESAYVAQVCLAWEALSWSYCSFRRARSNRDMEASSYPARTAQKFQQFQVLLQRFIENEPYEYGPRPQVFARTRLSCPKLLQVPEFRDSEGEDDGREAEAKMSSAEFLSVLEDSILTFLSFLEADKMTPCKKLRALINSKPSAVDPTYLRLLKKINKNKKLRLRELIRRAKYSNKKKNKKQPKLMDEQEMEVLMAIVDMKVVSRVLRARAVTEEQLHWCDEKMGRVRVWDGKMRRDSSPLFLPGASFSRLLAE